MWVLTEKVAVQQSKIWYIILTYVCPKSWNSSFKDSPEHYLKLREAFKKKFDICHQSGGGCRGGICHKPEMLLKGNIIRSFCHFWQMSYFFFKAHLREMTDQPDLPENIGCPTALHKANLLCSLHYISLCSWWIAQNTAVAQAGKISSYQKFQHKTCHKESKKGKLNLRGRVCFWELSMIAGVSIWQLQSCVRKQSPCLARYYS